MSLTPKQQRFVEEYLVDLNATQASIRAGYSKKTARQIGDENLSKPDIASAIRAAMDKRSKRTEITADRVLQELAKVGFANLSDVVDWGIKEIAIGFDDEGKKLRPEELGDAAVISYVDAPYVTPVNRDELAPEIRGAVAEVAITRDGFKIKMHDKAGALQQIGRHLGMFVEKVEVKDTTDLGERLRRARERARAARAG